MAATKEIRLGATAKAELWRRWRDGQSMSDIGRALSVSPASIYSQVRVTGGFTPTQRKRSARHLSLEDRETIACQLAAGASVRSIASQIGRAPSTVSREISRNDGVAAYRASQADTKAWRRAERPKQCLLAQKPALRLYVARKLRQRWSPQQIAGSLKSSRQGACKKRFSVSHETIYRSLFIQARNVLKRDLCAYLRRGRVARHGKTSTTKGQNRRAFRDAVSVRERPASVEDRAVPGHWEGDLIIGSNNSQIATMVERSTRFVILARVKNRDTKAVVASIIKQAKRLPISLRKTLTWDNGAELASHKKFSIATNASVFFCDPKSPWQRGSNENTNGLLRQYFPKRTDVSNVTQKELDQVAAQLNQRPRKTLDWDTPAERLRNLLH